MIIGSKIKTKIRMIKGIIDQFMINLDQKDKKKMIDSVKEKFDKEKNK
jgi:hypothetical protein